MLLFDHANKLLGYSPPRPRKEIKRIYIVSCAYETYGNQLFCQFSNYTILCRFIDHRSESQYGDFPLESSLGI